jgi:hypothetical protein
LEEFIASMERKRRMPARAAARVEQAAKKSRTETPLPPDHRDATPSSAVNSTPAPEDITQEPKEPQKPPPPPLPTSIQPGRPLPTIEDPQPEDLPNKDYQTLHERYGAIPMSPWGTFAPSLAVCVLRPFTY